jgi:CHAT domain-containing protein/Tfp pilus assembly protein PilF
MKLGHAGSLVFAVILSSPVFTLAQLSSNSPNAPVEPGGGIVVEKLDKHSEAGKAGISEGDVLLRWRRGEAQGAIRSPFDLVSVEIEQAPRGIVILEGLRNRDTKLWQLGQDDWGMETRPNLAEPFLSVYSEGRALATAGKVSEASERWRAMAGRADSDTALWLLFEIGQAQAEARQWKEADTAFQESIQNATTAEPDLQAQLLRARGQAFEQQSLWVEADQNYRQALGKDTQVASGQLAHALDLSHLGAMAMNRSDFDTGKRYCEDALALRQKLAAGSLVVAASLRELCEVADVRNELDNAENYCNQALQLATRLAPASLLTARILNRQSSVALHRGDLGKAQEEARRALEILDELAPGGLEAAVSLTSLAIVAHRRGDLAKAEEYNQRTLEIREKLAPGSIVVAVSLSNMGNDAADRGDLDKARQYYQRALDLREKVVPGSLQVAGSLYSLGAVYSQRGELDKAEEYQQRALKIREKLAPGGLEVADSFTGIGVLAHQRGDLDQAEQYYRQALAIREKRSPNSQQTALLLHNLGRAARERGDLAKAQMLFDQARAIYEKLAPGSPTVAAILTSLGVLALSQHDLAQAEEYLTQSLKIRQKLAPDSVEVAVTVSNLGLVALESGDYAKAEEYLQRGLGISQRLAPESVDVANHLNNLGELARLRGRLAEAEQYVTQAMTIRERLGPLSLDFAENLISLGLIVQQRGDLERAEQYYRRAISIWKELVPESGREAPALAGLAGIMQRRGRLEEAAQFHQQALDALESQTNRLGGTQDTRSGFRANYENYYQEYASLLVAQGKDELAFQVLEQSRARTLLEMLTSARLDIHRGADPAMLQKERTLLKNKSAASERRIQLLSRRHAEEQIEEVENEINHLREEYLSVEAQIRAGSPAYAALTQPEPPATEQVRKLLDANTVLLEYSLGQDRSYVFVVTTDSVASHELPKRDDIERLARSMYDALTARNRVIKGETSARQQARWLEADKAYARLAVQLSKMVLGPSAADIHGKRLLIVADGALHYVPFAALPEPSNTSASAPLMMAHEVVNLPSASVLGVLRRQEEGKKPAPKMVAVLADPVFSARDARLAAAPESPRPGHSRGALKLHTGASSSGSASSSPVNETLSRSVRDVGLLELSRLPFTRREADAIMSLTSPGQAMEALDFDATRAAATSPKLSQYRIVHFATHGLLDSRHPELSGLVLSLVNREGETQPGFLSLEDIYNLDLPADLVVLSACETGLGKEIDGEGLIGLTRGFMYAGASRVVASLWSVNDLATSELMARFYRGVLRNGVSPAAALRQAHIQMWKTTRWKSPYYWAAFQVQGEWK